MPAFDPRDLLSLEDALWAALGGDAAPGQRRALVSRLIASPEFQKLRASWRDGSSPAQSHDSGSDASDDAGFVRVAYECVLGRPADESGLRHYINALTAGESRANVLRALALSEEFEGRYARLPQDSQL